MSVDDKSARVVTAATIALSKPGEGAVFTITTDNGKNFAYHEVMAEHLQCGVYFADPYCSWQRGLNKKYEWIIKTILAEINRL